MTDDGGPMPDQGRRPAIVPASCRRIGPGAIVLVVGPSGAGKDTLIRMARDRLAGDGDVVFPRRIVTRAADGNEDHDTLTSKDFDRLVVAGGASLCWEAHGLSYAVPVAINAAIARGAVVVVNVSRAIVPVALEKFARVAVVFVTAPAEVLARRLAARGRESAEDVAGRLGRAEERLPAVPSLTVIQNIGDPEDGAERLAELVRNLAAATVA